MPPIRSVTGRAGKACETCRRNKTRCHPSSAPLGSCLRCETLNLTCSLDTHPTVSNHHAITPAPITHDCSILEKRVADLENTVRRLSSLLDAVSNPTTNEAPADIESPLTVIKNAASEIDLPKKPIKQQPDSANVVEQGLLSAADASELLALFEIHYKRWVTFRETEDLRLDLEHVESPLLLCVCCLIAIRHSTAHSARDTAAILYNEAKTLLERHILVTPQPIEFFQAVLLLSLWSTTIGHRPLSIDGWLVSGFALQHRFASDALTLRDPTKRSSSLDPENLTPNMLAVRLCLSHMHSAVAMRRKSMLNRTEIENITHRRETPGLSNYEARMIAELDLYWKIHEQCVAVTVALPLAQIVLQNWKQKWEELLAQPRSQFLQLGFQFAQLLVYEQSLNNRSTAAKESILSEMVTLSSSILRLAMATADERTKYLTDHIYHIITFAAISLCRLTHNYEAHLAIFKESIDVDQLLPATITWLQTLGTQLHVSNLMGGVIVNAYRKVRPDSRVGMPINTDADSLLPAEGLFTDLLGSRGLDCDWEVILSDWPTSP